MKTNGFILMNGYGQMIIKSEGRGSWYITETIYDNQLHVPLRMRTVGSVNSGIFSEYNIVRSRRSSIGIADSFDRTENER